MNNGCEQGQYYSDFIKITMTLFGRSAKSLVKKKKGGETFHKDFIESRNEEFSNLESILFSLALPGFLFASLHWNSTFHS